MVSTVPKDAATAQEHSSPEVFRNAFRWMLLARALDEKLASLYRAGKIPGGGVYLGRGQEALSVSIGLSLLPGDVFAPLIRDGAGRLAFGEQVIDAVRTCLGSPLGPMRARDGNVHRGKPKEGYLPMISHLGAMISVVNGVLMAKRFKGIRGVVGATSLGEGGTSTGAFHEAINQAAVENLPLVMVVADNQYAYSTPRYRQFSCESLVDKAIGYGIEGWRADGTSLVNCLEVVGAAVRNARAGNGPQLVVATLLRLCGHGEHDDAAYVDAKLKQSALGRDALKVAEDHLFSNQWTDRETIESWKRDCTHQIEEAVATVQRENPPDANLEKWCALATSQLSDGYEEII